LILFTIVHGQAQKIQRNLTPARGHYKQLSAFSPKPKSPHEEIDKKKFITDKGDH
jgi:acid phosphatase (class A)